MSKVKNNRKPIKRREEIAGVLCRPGRAREARCWARRKKSRCSMSCAAAFWPEIASTTCGSSSRSARSRTSSRNTWAQSMPWPFPTPPRDWSLPCTLRALGPGDEVIVPAYTFIATAAAVVAVRAIPILAEVDETLGLDPKDVEKKITPRTKCILPVHMKGAPCRMDELMKMQKQARPEDDRGRCAGLRRLLSRQEAGFLRRRRRVQLRLLEGHYHRRRRDDHYLEHGPLQDMRPLPRSRT